MADETWKDIAASDDIEDGSFHSVELSEEESVLLVRQGTELFAWEDSCTHVGCPLSYGYLADGVITCPCHNARFDARTGATISPPALDDLARYDVREDGGRVYLGPRHEAVFAKPGGSDPRTVAIVGAGAAGAVAAEQLRREGFAGRVVMITPETERPYDRPLLSKFYLAKDMGPDDIALRPQSFYEEMEIELWTGRRATAVDPEAKRITLEDGSDLTADAIVLATGSRPKALPVPGADLNGVHLLRALADAEGIRADAATAQNVVVIGASFIGTEAAAYLRGRGLSVTVTAPESVPFERTFGPEVGQRFRSMHAEQGVEFKLGTTVSRIVGSDRVESVELADGTILPADLVVIGVGAEPVVDYLEGSGLVEDGAVPVNGYLQTRAPGVYAVGDIARVDGTGGPKRVEHWVVAQRHGRQVARSIAGVHEPLPFAPFFWTRQFETSFGYIGYAPRFDDIRYKGDVEGGKFLAGYFEGGILRAVGTIGKGKTAVRYGRLLDAGREITVEQFEAGLSAIGG
jgi:NADPH-dependent 2,4-dienoyl-CoA reductase/sulfur reductase-like enzyme/nitrite reductase/ring-hydroxylating ferredoxin subunit